MEANTSISRRPLQKNHNLAAGGENVSSEKPAADWQVNDHCQAIYSGDGIWYEAEIIADNKNGSWCVMFVGFGNIENVYAKNLGHSRGERVRRQQIQYARDEADFFRREQAKTSILPNNSKKVDNSVVVGKYASSEKPAANPKSSGSVKVTKASVFQDCSVKGYKMADGKSIPLEKPEINADDDSSEAFSSSSEYSRESFSSTDSSSDEPELASQARRLSIEGERCVSPPPPFPADDSAYSALLLSWYMAGLNTGRYMGRRSRLGRRSGLGRRSRSHH